MNSAMSPKPGVKGRFGCRRFGFNMAYVGITELSLRKASQCDCTGNADSVNKIATACRWGFHKYSGIAHFVDEPI
jgi:hypothetical protein